MKRAINQGWDAAAVDPNDCSSITPIPVNCDFHWPWQLPAAFFPCWILFARNGDARWICHVQSEPEGAQIASLQPASRPSCLKPELRLGSPLQILARPVTTPGIISHCSAARTINIWIAGRERNHKRMSAMKWDSRWLKLAQCYWAEYLVCRSRLCFLLSTWPMLYDPAPNHKGKEDGGIGAQPSLHWLECLSPLLSKSEKRAFLHVFSSCATFKINAVPPNVSINLPVPLDFCWFIFYP